nr:thioesterase family protein [Natranaeroarchaeum aerophilus]
MFQTGLSGDVSDYEYTTTIEKRYNDFDTYGHVNNAVYVTYLESARIKFFRDVIGDRDVSTVIAHVEVDYESPILVDHEVTVAVRVAEFGTTSVTLDYEIRADGERAATARTTQVILDEDGDPRPVPEEWAERLALDVT